MWPQKIQSFYSCRISFIAYASMSSSGEKESDLCVTWVIVAENNIKMVNGWTDIIENTSDRDVWTIRYCAVRYWATRNDLNTPPVIFIVIDFIHWGSILPAVAVHTIFALNICIPLYRKVCGLYWCLLWHKSTNFVSRIIILIGWNCDRIVYSQITTTFSSVAFDYS